MVTNICVLSLLSQAAPLRFAGRMKVGFVPGNGSSTANVVSS